MEQTEPRYSVSDSHKDAVAPAYTLTARVLHWLTAVLIFSVIALGIVIGNEWGGSLQSSLFDLHRSIGALLIPVILLRLLYRWFNRPLPLPDTIPVLQRFAAHATHVGLYVLPIVQAIVGWMGTSAYRAPIPVFGFFELPPILPQNRALSVQLFTVHSLLGIAIAGLITVHIGAALFHHFVRRDGILKRMTGG
jgi:cytochrome b561